MTRKFSRRWFGRQHLLRGKRASQFLGEIAGGRVSRRDLIRGGTVAGLSAPLLGAGLTGRIARRPGQASADTSGTATLDSATTTPLAISAGGTGQVTAGAAFSALAPMTSTGDMIYQSGAGTAARLAAGKASQDLVAAISGTPAWVNSMANVQAFGAVADGVTDDTAAIQNAMNTAAGGGMVIFPKPAAQYLVTGDIQVPGQVTIIGPGWDHSTPTVKLKASSGASCVFGSEGWLTNAATSDGPVIIRDLSIDVDGASNPATHGIVLMTVRSRVDHCFITDPGMCGIVLADEPQKGTKLKNSSADENRISSCTVVYPSPKVTPGQYGIWIQDHNSGLLTDGYLADNVVQGCGDWSIRHERAAGWFITGNHTYDNQQSGMYFGHVWCTFCHHNEVDFGLAGKAGTTYTGFEFEILQQQPTYDGRPSFIDHNIATSDEAAGTSTTTYHYYVLRNQATAGQSVTQFDHNIAHSDKTGTGTSVAWQYEPNGATMNVIGGFNVADGPAAIPIAGGGTLNQVAASRIMYKQFEPVTVGTSSTFGAATEFTTERASLGFVPVAVVLDWGGTFRAGEQATAQITATYSDGSTNTLTFGSVTSAETQSANDGQRFSLFKDNVYLTRLAVFANSTRSSTSVTCTAGIAGFNAN